MALRIGQARPRDVALAEVEVGGAQSAQPGHLRCFVVTGVGQQVKMDAVWHGLHAGRAEELEIRADTAQSIASPQNRAMARGSAQSTTTRAIGPVSR